MLNASKLKEVVEKNRKYIKIESRIEMIRMVYFVAELLCAAGYKDASYFVIALTDELEDMDTEEIIKERIW